MGRLKDFWNRITGKEAVDYQQQVAQDERDIAVKNTLIVNMFAGPGAGKTTAAWWVAAELKKQNILVEYVPEYAKELVWDENVELLDGTTSNQRLIYAEMKHKIERLIGKVDVIVTDSPTILSLAYLNKDKNNIRDLKAFQYEVTHDWSKYSCYNCFIVRDLSQYENEGRIHNFSESRALDHTIKELLLTYKINYKEYSHAKLPSAVDDILKAMGQENKRTVQHHCILKPEQQTAESKANTLHNHLDALDSREDGAVYDISAIRTREILALAIKDYADRMSEHDFYDLLQNTLMMSDHEIRSAGIDLEQMLGSSVATITYHYNGEIERFYQGQEAAALKSFVDAMDCQGPSAVGYKIAPGHDDLQTLFAAAVADEFGCSAEENQEEEYDMEMSM